MKPALGAALNRAHPQLRGLIAWWPLWEGSGNRAVDIVGQQHGTFGATTASPTWAGGRNGTALSFDGGDDVDCGTDARFDALAAFTVTAWVNSASLAAVQTIFGADEPSGTTPPILCRIVNTSGQPNMFADTSTGQPGLSGTTSAVVVGVWAHLAWRFNGANFHVFKNAIQDATTVAATGTTDAVDGKIRLGAWSSSGTLTHKMNGRVSDVRFYNRALTTAEIRQIMLDPWAPFARTFSIF